MQTVPSDLVVMEVKTLEGTFVRETLTREEYQEWDKYADSHGRLLGSIGYEATLRVFLGHFRRGTNLNIPVKKRS